MNIDYFKTEKIASSLQLLNFLQFTNIPVIRHKIRLGFFLTLSIMTVGVMMGKIAADRTVETSHEKLAILNEQGSDLTTIQIEFIRINADQKESLYSNIDSATSIIYHKKILNNLSKIESLIDQIIKKHNINSFILDTNNYNYSQLIKILPLYKTLVIEYRQSLKLAMSETDLRDIKFGESLAISEKLKSAIISPTAFELDRMSLQIGNSLLDFQVDNKNLMAEVERIETIELYIFFFSFLISLIAASLITWQISRAIATPLEAATAVAQKFTETGDASLRVPITTGDETGKLATALNQLIERVSNSTHTALFSFTDDNSNI